MIIVPLLCFMLKQDSLQTLTVDEYFSKHPDVKEKIDDEIRNQNWGY